MSFALSLSSLQVCSPMLLAAAAGSGSSISGDGPLEGDVPSIEIIGDRTSPASPAGYTLLTHHLNCLGNTGRVFYRDNPIGRDTCLNANDEQRALYAAEAYLRSGADFLCISGVFDRDIADLIIRSVEDVYPYHATGSFGPGISAMLDFVDEKESFLRRWGGLASRIVGIRIPRDEPLRDFGIQRADQIIRLHTKMHHGLGPRFLDNRIVQGIITKVSQQLRDRCIWGAGLLFLSRHPIREYHFHSYEKNTGLDLFGENGFLHAVIQPTGMNPFSVFITCLQRGVRSDERAVRMQQIGALSCVLRKTDHPAIVAGCFHVEAEVECEKEKRLIVSADYRELQRVLALRDAYRAHKPDPNEFPGYTHDHGSVYAELLEVTRAGRRSRIDKIFVSDHFGVRRAWIPHEDYLAPDDLAHLSELSPYRPVMATVTLGANQPRPD